MKVSNLLVQINNKSLVNKIGFETKQAGIVGVLGQNGAGKTTLFKALSDIIEFEGEVDSHRVGYLGSAFMVSSELTTNQILDYSRNTKSPDLSYKAELVKAFELESFLNRSSNSLSGGELQRLNLACVFYQDEEVLLLDEPTNFLDPKHVEILENFLLSRAKDKLMLVSSHDINFIIDISQDVMALKGGELLFLEETTLVLKEKKLDKIFDKKFTYFEIESRTFVK